MFGSISIEVAGDGRVPAGGSVSGEIVISPGAATHGRILVEWAGPVESGAARLAGAVVYNGPLPDATPTRVPFELKAPSGPLSYEGGLFHVRHSVRARLDRSGIDATAEEPIQLVAPSWEHESRIESLTQRGPIEAAGHPTSISAADVGVLLTLAGGLTVLRDGVTTPSIAVLGVGVLLLAWSWLRRRARVQLGLLQIEASSQVVYPGDAIDVEVRFPDGVPALDTVVARVVCEEERRPRVSTRNNGPVFEVQEDAAYRLDSSGDSWRGVVGVPPHHRPTQSIVLEGHGAWGSAYVRWKLSVELYRKGRLLGRLDAPLAMPAALPPASAPGKAGTPEPVQDLPLPTLSDPRNRARARVAAYVVLAAIGAMYFLRPYYVPSGLPGFLLTPEGVVLSSRADRHRSPYLHDSADPGPESPYRSDRLEGFELAGAAELRLAEIHGFPTESEIPNLGRRVTGTAAGDLPSWCWTPSPGGTALVGCFGVYHRDADDPAWLFEALAEPPIDVRWIDDDYLLVVHGSESSGYGAAVVSSASGTVEWQTPETVPAGGWSQPVVYAPTGAPVVAVSWGAERADSRTSVPTYRIDRSDPTRVATDDLWAMARIEAPDNGIDGAAYFDPPGNAMDIWYTWRDHPVAGTGGVVWVESRPLSDPYLPPNQPTQPTESWISSGGREFGRATTTAQTVDDQWFLDVPETDGDRRATWVRLDHSYELSSLADESWSVPFSRSAVSAGGGLLWDDTVALAPKLRRMDPETRLAVFSGASWSSGHGETTQYFLLHPNGSIGPADVDDCRGSQVSDTYARLSFEAERRFQLACSTLFDVQAGAVSLPGGESIWTGWAGPRVIKIGLPIGAAPNAYLIDTDGSTVERFRFDGWITNELDGDTWPRIQSDTDRRILVLADHAPCETPERVYVVDEAGELFTLTWTSSANPSGAQGMIRWEDVDGACTGAPAPARYLGDLEEGTFARVGG